MAAQDYYGGQQNKGYPQQGGCTFVVVVVFLKEGAGRDPPRRTNKDRLNRATTPLKPLNPLSTMLITVLYPFESNRAYYPQQGYGQQQMPQQVYVQPNQKSPGVGAGTGCCACLAGACLCCCAEEMCCDMLM
ncbi:BQ5605_C022g09492 [Microbotryum silenes-dioicae]|uniref:BQ5605_C022g09492 protein n=1 Tax=Microbotryum silenes-dioicae TaxID=796604 RepID=A0A2X0PEK2_9BASI|nr:BQ5605_C022g09492 [Microbotryum silenes-dioicae]